MEKNYTKKRIFFSLPTKIGLSVFILSTFLFSLITYIYYQNEKKYKKEAIESSAENLAYSVSIAFEQLIEKNKFPALQNMIEHISKGEKCSGCHGTRMGAIQELAEGKTAGIGIIDAIVADKNLNIIASYKKGIISKNIRVLENRSRHLDASKIIIEAFKTKKKVAFFDMRDDHYEIATPFSIDKNDKINTNLREGVVFLSIEKSNLFKAVKGNFLKIFLLFIGIFAGNGLILFLILRKILVTPMQNLLEGVNSLRNGSFPQLHLLKTKNEFGLIHKSFNEMSATLQKREGELLERNKELSALIAIANILIKPFETENPFGQLIEKVLEITDMDAGAVHILDRNRMELKIISHKGLTDEYVSGIDNLKLGEGFAGRAAETGEIISSENVLTDPRLSKEIAKKYEYNSLVSIPLKSKGNILGTMTITKKGVYRFDEKWLGLLSSIGNQIGVFLENAVLAKETKDKAKHIEVINQINRIINSSLEIKETYRTFAEEIKKLIDYERISIVLADKAGKNIHVIAVKTKEHFRVGKGKTVSKDGYSIGWVLDNGKPFIRTDTSETKEFVEDRELSLKGLKSYVTVPIISKGINIGTLNLANYPASSYNENHLKILTSITEQLAVAIENSRLFEEIVQSKKEWENTFDSITDFVSIHDLEYNILKVNTALAKRLNIPQEELLGKKCYEIFHCSSTYHSDCPHKKTLETMTPCSKDIEFSGSIAGTYTISASPVFDENKKLIGTVHYCKDITEQKKLREQLLQSEKMSAIGQLVSGVAHELNNPMAGIVGYSQLLLKKDLEDKVKKGVVQISEQAERATKIVQNLLTFARQKKPERMAANINELLNKTIELRAYDLNVKNIKVVTELDPHLPQIIADNHQLQQVFLNIIINAEQAMLATKGKGTLTIRTEFKTGSENIVKILFIDDGPGISKENLNKIFNPFFTTKDVGKGTGLGLSICYGIINEHNGKIYAETASGEGTTFVIELPLGYLQSEKKDSISLN